MNNEPEKDRLKYEPGTIVGGDYKLLQSIGRGGMGEVFAAEHKYIAGRVCALKILAPHLITERTWQRFEREARALARLEHAGIVRIYTMGVDRETCPYYVMELIKGETLSQLLGQVNRLSPEPAIDIFLQVADALDSAHRSGIIHRDLKPSNIMLVTGRDSTRPQVKIVDFGVASLVEGADKQKLTEIGEAVGTPLYMSPEQFLGQPVAEPADIYSMGCSLFESLTGRPPFRGSTALETIHMHQYQLAPRLADAYPRGEFSADLEHIVARMLAKLPANRYQNMRQVIHDFDRLQSGMTLVDAKRAVSLQSAEEPHSPPLFGLPDWRWWQWTCAVSPLLIVIIAMAPFVLRKTVSAPLMAPILSTEHAIFKDPVKSAPPRTTASLVSSIFADDDEGDLVEAIHASPPFNVNIKDKQGSTYFQFPNTMPVGRMYVSGTRLLAQGLVKCPPGEIPTFTIGSSDSLLAISKFRPDTVHLEVEVSTARQLAQLGEMTRGWKQILYCRLVDYHFEQSDVALLDALPAISQLHLDGCTLGQVDFAGSELFKKRVSIWRMDTPPEIISTGTPLPAGIRSFASACFANPNLPTLYFVRTTLCSELVSMICAAPHVDAVNIDRCELDYADFKKLCHKSQLIRLAVLETPFSYEQVRAALGESKHRFALVLTNPHYSPMRQESVRQLPAALPGLTEAWSKAQIGKIARLVSRFELRERDYVHMGHASFKQISGGLE